MLFTKWDHRFMQLTDTIAQWASCFKEDRKMGCVIVRDKRIITTGYNGAPSGITPCVERGECMRVREGVPSGTRGEFCYAVHAEQNALIQAAKLGVSVQGATLYCSNQPCAICARLIINAGIATVIYKNDYPDPFSVTLMQEAGLPMYKYEPV